MINVQNISSKLAIMPDAALKQYAEMHKDDPYTFSLALSESNRRKELRSQAPQAAPQPKVIDQELADMDVRKALPEDLGIARLPVDMNMAGGGIVAFGGGGDVDYSNEGRNSVDTYRAYALAKAQEKGVDPTLVDSIFKIESGYNPNAVSKTGPVGIGQLTKATGKAYGVSPEDRTDPYKNIDASISYIADLNRKYDGNPSKIAVGYNQGETVLNKHLRANKGELNASTLPAEAQGYLKKLQKFAFNIMPGATAQAKEIPYSQPAATNPASNESQPDQASDYGTAATAAGIAAAGLGYYPAKAGLETLKNNIKAADAARVAQGSQMEAELAKQVARNTDLPRLPGPSGQGVSVATDEAIAKKAAERLAAKQAAITGSEMAGQYGARAAWSGLGNVAKLALNPAVQGLGAIGYGLGEAQRGVMAAPGGEKLREALQQNPMLGAMDPDAAFGAAIMDAPRIQAESTNPKARVDDRTKRDPRNYRTNPAAPMAPEEVQRETQSLLNRNPAPAKPEAIIQAAKAVTPPTADNEGWSGNDWLQFGLSLMAGQSPYAMQNIGNAGLNVIASKVAKQEAQNKNEMYRAIHLGQPIQVAQRLMAEDPSLTFEKAVEKASYFINGGAAKEMTAEARAEAVLANKIKNYQAGMKAIRGSIVGIMGTGPKATPESKKALQDAIDELGPNPALEGGQLPAKNTVPTAVIPGAKIVGTR